MTSPSELDALIEQPNHANDKGKAINSDTQRNNNNNLEKRLTIRLKLKPSKINNFQMHNTSFDILFFLNRNLDYIIN